MTSHSDGFSQTLVTNDNFRDLITVIERASSKGAPVGFDSESSVDEIKTLSKSTIIYAEQSNVLGFSVAVKGHTWYVPVNHRSNNVQRRNAKAVLRALTFLKSPLWAHNWGWDMRAMEQDFPGFYDNLQDPRCSMVIAWMAGMSYRAKGKNGLGSPSYGLKPLAKHYLGRESPEYNADFSSATPKTILRYACHDAMNTLQIGNKAWERLHEKGKTRYVELERPFTKICVDMQRNGFNIDREMMANFAGDAELQQAAVLEQWDFLCPGIDIGSSTSLQQLYETGVWQHPKTWSRGKWIPLYGKERQNTWDDAMAWAKDQSWSEGMTKKAMKEDKRTVEYKSRAKAPLIPTGKPAREWQLKHLPENAFGRVVVDMLQAYNDYTKILSTYTRSLVHIADQYEDGKLHPSFIQIGTQTNRLASRNPNFQNQIARGVGADLKKAYKPAPGNVFVAADYSQLELRVIAHFAGNGLLMQNYLEGKDVHEAAGKRIGRDRHTGKTFNFSLAFGQGAGSLAMKLGITVREATRLLKEYFAAIPEVVALKEKVVARSKAIGYSETMFGFRRYLPGFKAGNGGSVSSAERRAFSTFIQGSAADIVKRAMLEAYEKKLVDNTHTFMVAQVHDELLLECKAGTADRVASDLQRIMEDTTTLRVPLVAKPIIATDWYGCK